VKRLAFFVWVLALVAYVGDVVLLFATAGLPGDELSPLLQALEDLPFVFVATVGYLILRRQPGNAIGWVAILAGLSFPLEGLTSELAQYGLANWGPTPLTLLAVWVSLWIWLLGVGSVPYLLLLYPNGRLPSPRWRPALWLVSTDLALAFLISAFTLEHLEDYGGLANPLGWAAFNPAAEALAGAVYSVIPLLILLGAVSLVFRYRASGPVQRHQIKWLVWVGVVSVPFFAYPQLVDVPEVLDVFLNIAFTSLVAWAIANAVLRRRLYDIDRLVNRTVVYAVVVLVLVGVYVVGVLGVGAILGGEAPPVVVAGATLAAAGLFSPVQRRVQSWVDRRFDRTRYDAQMVVERFSTRLRDEVDLEGLSHDLTAVVSETLRPAAVSLVLVEES
jgi:hypothetical protein